MTLIQSPSSERTKKESLLDVVATQQKRAHMAIINEQWKLVFQVAILIVGTRKFSFNQSSNMVSLLILSK